MTAIEFLDSLIGQEASKRTKRQLTAVKKWVTTGCMGTVEWPTGVGKTRIATTAIQVMRRHNPIREFIVVVPTIPLKNQWEEGLAKLGLSDRSKVIVINGLVRKRVKVKTELLVLDEIHRYAAKTFAKVFDIVETEYILGLTATLKRLDKKHKILEAHAKIIDKMSLFEARRDGYMAIFREYNLGITMTEEELGIYAPIYSSYQYYMNKFHQDFDLMKFCAMGLEPRIKGEEYIPPSVVRYAMRLGWKGNTPYQAYQVLMNNRIAPRGHKKDLWGGDLEHPYHPRKLYISAILGMRSIRAIKNFVYSAPGKTDAVVALLKAFNRKAICFGEKISRVEEIHTRLPEITVVYHSDMTKRNKLKSLSEIMTNPRIKAILTARALDLGFDWPEFELGIIESRTSSPTQQTQRRGRVVRTHTFEDGSEKQSVIINIYLKDTKDFDWMKKGQVGSGPVKWVESIHEIVQAEGLSVVKPITELREEL